MVAGRARRAVAEENACKYTKYKLYIYKTPSLSIRQLVNTTQPIREQMTTAAGTAASFCLCFFLVRTVVRVTIKKSQSLVFGFLVWFGFFFLWYLNWSANNEQNTKARL